MIARRQPIRRHTTEFTIKIDCCYAVSCRLGCQISHTRDREWRGGLKNGPDSYLVFLCSAIKHCSPSISIFSIKVDTQWHTCTNSRRTHSDRTQHLKTFLEGVSWIIILKGAGSCLQFLISNSPNIVQTRLQFSLKYDDGLI